MCYGIVALKKKKIWLFWNETKFKLCLKDIKDFEKCTFERATKVEGSWAKVQWNEN